MKRIPAFCRRIPLELWQIGCGALLLTVAWILGGIPGIVLYSLALLATGITVWIDAVRGILRRDLLDEKFLMTIASFGAFAIGEYREGVAVMLFFLIGEYFEHRAVAHSRKSIRTLMDIRPDRASVLRDGVESEIDADDVAVGETVVLRPGGRVPIDCTVLTGEALINTAAVTGESVPVRARAGTSLQSGTLCLDGVLTARTDRLCEESAASRILTLVESANERKSKQETFISRFSHIYTPAVVGAAILLAVLVPICLGGGAEVFRTWIHRALIFLVVSCPCALVISVPLSFFGGIGCAASLGILFKGGNRMQAISHPGVVCFDKTGTLTRGEFAVTAVSSVSLPEKELLRLAASAEYGSTHPIARAIRQSAPGAPTPAKVEERAGRGIVASVEGRQVAVGNALLLRELGALPPAGTAGAVLVALDGVYAGAISVGDSLREEAKPALDALRALGARKLVMLTGDSEENARPVSEYLGIDEFHAGLLPDGKFACLEKLIGSGNGSVMFIGDGINDAPVLARADIGMAMGGIGSDAAIEASDAVIMSDNLRKIPVAVRIARHTLLIAKENIVFALAVKLAILVLSATGLNDSMWLAVFADVGVAVIAILNAMRAMRPDRSAREGEPRG